MKKHMLPLALLAGVLALSAGLAVATTHCPQPNKGCPQQSRCQTGNPDCPQKEACRNLLTDEQRAEMQARMQAAQTDEEREQIRKECHELMQAEAERQGVELPAPPAPGAGCGCRQNRQAAVPQAGA